MGKFADEMIDLQKQIKRDRQERNTLKQKLQQGHRQLEQDVNKMLQQAGKERRDANILGSLEDFRAKIGEEVAQIRHETNEWRKKHRELQEYNANQGKQERQEFGKNLRSDVMRLLATASQDRTAKAKVLMKELHEYRTQVATFLSDLRAKSPDRAREAVRFRKEVEKKRSQNLKDLQAIAQKGREDRAVFMFDLRKTVNESRKEAQSVLSEFSKDLQRIRGSWQGTAVSETLREDASPPIAEAQAQITETVKTDETGQTEISDMLGELEGADDDLTLIKGIGEERQKLLNDATIHTFSDLAATTQERLCEIMEKRIGEKEAKDWIRQAKLMLP